MEKKDSAEFVATLSQETECFYCFGEMENAHMCPHCKKCGCKKCFTECIKNNGKCPFCRKELKIEELLGNDFMNAMKNVNY